MRAAEPSRNKHGTQKPSGASAEMDAPHRGHCLTFALLKRFLCSTAIRGESFAAPLLRRLADAFTLWSAVTRHRFTCLADLSATQRRAKRRDESPEFTACTIGARLTALDGD